MLTDTSTDTELAVHRANLAERTHINTAISDAAQR
jgi:hypothetical protein